MWDAGRGGFAYSTTGARAPWCFLPENLCDRPSRVRSRELSSGCFAKELRRLMRNRRQPVLDGKQHQVCIALQIERVHDVVLVEFDSFFA